jgi:hypothetical protein
MMDSKLSVKIVICAKEFWISKTAEASFNNKMVVLKLVTPKGAK